MFIVWYLQLYQTMVITSLVVSLVPVAILSLQSQSDQLPVGIIPNLSISTVRIVTAVVITICLNTIIKVSLHQTADNNIFKFLKNKLFADSINSVIHIFYADNPPSMENSINIIDGADQQQKEDIIQHCRLSKSHASINNEGQVNHKYSQCSSKLHVSQS